jgi:hypothetical protein
MQIDALDAIDERRRVRPSGLHWPVSGRLAGDGRRRRASRVPDQFNVPFAYDSSTRRHAWAGLAAASAAAHSGRRMTPAFYVLLGVSG